MPKLIVSLGLLLAVGLTGWCSAAETTVTVVFGSERSNDRGPTRELSEILKKLTGGEVAIARTMPPGDGPVILLGNPRSTPVIAEAIPEWPKLSEQGHLIKSAKLGNRDVLVVGGGSDMAIRWAVYELGHQHGVRYLLQTDVYPPEPVPLKLTGFDLVFEPARKVRPFMLGSWPLGTATWTVADHERLLTQLAKMKFSRAQVDEMKEMEHRHEWKIDGETAGRAAFGGASKFASPFFADLKPNEDFGQRQRSVVANLIQQSVLKGLAGAWSDRDEPAALSDKAELRVLPTLNSRGLALLQESPQKGGIGVDFGPFGDLNPAVYYLSRAGFDAELTPEKAYHELFTTVCGKEDVADRLLLGFQAIDKATVLLNEKSPRFSTPEPDMLLTLYKAGAAPPDWFGKLKELHTESMVEMFRARDNCRPDTRPLLYYHCKRGEFAVEYLNAVEAVQQAGAAKKEGDGEKAVEQLEKSVESLYNGINSLSEVARDQSDRALIAVLNEYAYRPLLKLLDAELEAAE